MYSSKKLKTVRFINSKPLRTRGKVQVKKLILESITLHRLYYSCSVPAKGGGNHCWISCRSPRGSDSNTYFGIFNEGISILGFLSVQDEYDPVHGRPDYRD